MLLKMIVEHRTLVTKSIARTAGNNQYVTFSSTIFFPHLSCINSSKKWNFIVILHIVTKR